MGGRSVYGHVITKFSGMGRLYSYGATSTRALRAREELRYKSTLIRNAQAGTLLSVFVKISVCFNCNFSFAMDFNF